jgi:hypothetical protein
MTLLTIIFSVMLIGGAIADWMKVPKLVESVRHVKVPEVLIPYFMIAVWFHRRVKDTAADTAPATVFGVLALVVVVLRLTN